MKIKQFEPVFFDSSEGKNVLINLLSPYDEEVRESFGASLEEVIADKALWTKLCTNAHKIPSPMYEILANISEFGKESYRDIIINVLKDVLKEFNKACSCQYLVAQMLLHCPEKIKLLEAKRISDRRRRFFSFSITDGWPQAFTIKEFREKILSAATIFAEYRTSLGESVQLANLDDLTNDGCWQFNIELCNQIKTTTAYIQKERSEHLLILPIIGHIIVRVNHLRRELEINIESNTQARMFAKMLSQEIWQDNIEHFVERPIFDLSPIQSIGSDVVQTLNPEVNKIIVNMVEFWNADESYPTRFGRNSKTVNVTDTLDRIKTCKKIEQIYFSAVLNNNDCIKFGIMPPDKLDLTAAHRPFVYSLIEEMGLLA